MKFKINQSFTLIELLIVLALIAILATILIVTLKPTEIFKKSRDTQRIANLKQIDQALTAIQATNPTFNELNYFSPNTVYLSLKMNTATSNCLVDYPDLPPLPSGWSYRCSQTPTAINDSGWIPLNFNNFPIVNLAQLPIDPINKPPYYYSFVVGGSYKLTAKPEINYGPAINDNGIEPLLYEVGTDLKLSTFQSGLVGYWSFDEGSGTTAYDKSGYGNNGILVNSPQWTTGKVGGALSFDGVDDYVNIPYSSSLYLNGDNETIILWVKHNNSNNIFFQSNGWNRRLFNNSWAFYRDGHVNFSVNSGIHGDNSWHLVAYTSKGTTITTFLDTTQVAVSNQSTKLEPANSDYWLGRVCSGSSCALFYQGLIDEVRVYNRALSAEEIKALYGATK